MYFGRRTRVSATTESATTKPRKKAGRKPRAKEATLTRRELALNIHKKLRNARK